MDIRKPDPFVFSGGGMDRLTGRYADESWLTAQMADPATRFVPVVADDNLLDANAAPVFLGAQAVGALQPFIHCTVLLGGYHGHIYFALGLTERTPLPAGAVRSNLRPQFGLLDDGLLALLGYARSMVHWHTQNHFCGVCGAATRSQHAGHERQCTRCGNIVYPRVNPAIIVLITHGERCLLGRQPSWAANRYSTIAGFVEPGENAEAALRREVLEETNIRIGCMHYLHSQPWPYPASLMLAYRAAADNTDIRRNDGELADARWFSRPELVQALQSNQVSLPAPQAIAHALIRGWFDEAGETSLETVLASRKSGRTS